MRTSEAATITDAQVDQNRVIKRKEVKVMTSSDRPISPVAAVDELGYLKRTETWTEDVARHMAEDEVPEGLTEDHWRVIDYIREYYLEMDNIPPVRMVARQTGFSLREMQRMFPHGLAKGACKLAGIPADAIKPSFLYP